MHHSTSPVSVAPKKKETELLLYPGTVSYYCRQPPPTSSLFGPPQKLKLPSPGNTCASTINTTHADALKAARQLKTRSRAKTVGVA